MYNVYIKLTASVQREESPGQLSEIVLFGSKLHCSERTKLTKEKDKSIKITNKDIV